MRSDEFLARLQQVRDGKQLVDLLVQASVVAPPLKAPWMPEYGANVAPMVNTPWVAAGTCGEVTYSRVAGGHYKIEWATGRDEEMNKAKHDAYQLVYVY